MLTLFVLFLLLTWGPTLTLFLIVAIVAALQVSKTDIVLFVSSLIWREKPSFAGKLVWVTGASSGIGEEFCYQLAKAGARLVISARRLEELERVRKNCANSSQHIVLPLDLAAHQTHQEVVAKLLETLGPNQGVDILINNAGRSQRSLAEDTPISVLQQQLELNTVGTVSLTQSLLPHLISRARAANKQNLPQIVVVSSLAGKMGAPASSSYSASKHALHGYFDTLRMELSEYGIGVCMLCPGPVVSDGANNAITASGKSASESGSPHSAYHHRRMGTAPACEAMLKAVSLRLHEAWVSPNPELLFAYVVHYAPMLAAYLTTTVGGGRAQAFRKQAKSN